MEIRLVIFLAFTAVAVISNSALIWLMYKGFGNLTSQIAAAAHEFEKSSQTRSWIASLQSASENAVSVTETVKRSVADCDPKLEQMQVKYEFSLAKVDTRLESLASEITECAHCVRDAVAKPAEKFAAIATGIQDVLGFVVLDDDAV